MKHLDGFLIFLITLLFGCPRARADPIVELSGATGAGVLAAGVTSGRFALSPSASVSVRGERWFFVARDTASFLGATGGRFGITNETTLGGGQCDKIHDRCHADCNKNDPTASCHATCNNEYGACLKECDQDCKGH